MAKVLKHVSAFLRKRKLFTSFLSLLSWKQRQNTKKRKSILILKTRSHSQLDVPFIHSIYIHLSIVAKVLVLSTKTHTRVAAGWGGGGRVNSLFLMSCLILMAMMKMAKKSWETTHRKLSMKDEKRILFCFFSNSFFFFFIFPINTKIERTWLLRYWWFSIFLFFVPMMKKNKFFISIFSAFLIEKMSMRTNRGMRMDEKSFIFVLLSKWRMARMHFHIHHCQSITVRISKKEQEKNNWWNDFVSLWHLANIVVLLLLHTAKLISLLSISFWLFF